MQQSIIRHFHESASLKQQCADQLAPRIQQAALLLCDALDQGGRILSCGNGGSACDAQHFAAELVNRFEKPRRALAAMALTCDSAVVTSVANDDSYARVFARQIEAWGNSGDILVTISTSGNSANILHAIDVAHTRHMRVINLGGRDGGMASQRLTPTDIDIRVPSYSTARIQEVHLLVIHCMCDIVDDHFSR